MVDIANIVQYEKPFSVALKHGGADVGITIDMLSFDSEKVVRAVRPVDARRVAALYGPKAEEIAPEQIVEMSEEADRERLVAAISGWDFGGNSFADLGVDPECNEKNKRYLVNHPNSLWIRHQLMAAGGNAVNFTSAPAKPSPSSSGTK